MRSAAWRPDSRALALTADSHQRDEYSYERADLWMVDLDGKIRRLTDDGFEHDSPVWTSDGQSLIFRRQQGLNQIIQARAEPRRGSGSVSHARCRRSDDEPDRGLGSDPRGSCFERPIHLLQR